jgi:hypothetical protein
VAEEFKIKDSGQRLNFESGMQRDTQDDKPMWSLLIPLIQPLKDTMLYRWMMQVTVGAKKYKKRNWEQAAGLEELERFRESAFRHFMQWYGGERDEDHAAATFFNITGAEYVTWRLKKAQDDTRKMNEQLARITNTGKPFLLPYKETGGHP